MWPAGLHWGNSQSDVSVFSAHLQQQVSAVWSSQSSDFSALHSQRAAIGYIESQTKRVEQSFSCSGLPRSLGTSQRFCLRSLLIYNEDGANSRSEDLLWWGTVRRPWPGLAHSTLTAPSKRPPNHHHPHFKDKQVEVSEKPSDWPKSHSQETVAPKPQALYLAWCLYDKNLLRSDLKFFLVLRVYFIKAHFSTHFYRISLPSPQPGSMHLCRKINLPKMQRCIHSLAKFSKTALSWFLKKLNI